MKYPLPSSAVMLGSGGHARAVAALAAEAITPLKIDKYISNQIENQGIFGGLQFLPEEKVKLEGWDGTLLLNGIGASIDAKHRHSIFANLLASGFSMVNLISRSSYVERDVELGNGLQIFQNSTIQTGCVIGDDVVVGAGAVVEHDTIVGSGSFLAPGALIMGGVVIEEEVSIFAGAILLPGVRVGRGAVVGAGAVVRNNVPSFEVHAGNPAVCIGRRE